MEKEVGKVVIATTVFGNKADGVREGIAINTTKALILLGYPVVIAYGGPSKELRQTLDDLGAIVLDEAPGEKMGVGRRQALGKAAEIAGTDGVVIWMEPEKLGLVPFIEKMADPILRGGTDLVIPRRASMEAYPQEQIHAEWVGNKIFNSIVGKGNYDIWFGPFAANRKALRYFLEYKGTYGDRWDAILVPRLEVIKDGLKVDDVPVNYIHPSEQTREEEGNLGFMHKRVIQLSALADAFMEEGKRLGMI